ncbi:MAG: glutamate--cysteine ligase, partial [Shewanellaceae bacterium]|nr:glutamate--cysteine ligase [Shewanellaceae bacterium]
MLNAFQSLLTEFDTPAGRQALGEIARGVEREALRIQPTGSLATTPHPTTLGSALTHPWITTDYSESLLELITPVTHDVKNLLDQLADLHQFTYRHLPAQEQLWPVSMPVAASAKSVPIAQYGSSMVGQMKTLYREGLACRYGALMQIIAGLHYNFSLSPNFWAHWHRLTDSSLSLPEFQNER